MFPPPDLPRRPEPDRLFLILVGASMALGAAAAVLAILSLVL